MMRRKFSNQLYHAILRNLFLIDNQLVFLGYFVYKINIFVYDKLININLMLAQNTELILNFKYQSNIDYIPYYILITDIIPITLIISYCQLNEYLII